MESSEQWAKGRGTARRDVSPLEPPHVSIFLVVVVSQDCATVRKVRTYLLTAQRGCQANNAHCSGTLEVENNQLKSRLLSSSASVGTKLGCGRTCFGDELPAVCCQAEGLKAGAGECLVGVWLGNVSTELLKQARYWPCPVLPGPFLLLAAPVQAEAEIALALFEERKQSDCSDCQWNKLVQFQWVNEVTLTFTSKNLHLMLIARQDILSLKPSQLLTFKFHIAVFF